MRRRNGEAPRAHEGVVEELPRRGVRYVGGHERELRVHGRGADVPPRLERIRRRQLPRTGPHVPPKVQNFRLGNAEARGGERPLLQDGELLVGVGEGDGALEAEVGEGVYYGGTGGGGAGSLEGVEGELEGGGLVARVGVLV